MTLQATRFDVRRYAGAADRHAHDHHQIVLPMQGVLEMDIDGTEGAVTANRAAVIPSGRLHSFAGSNENAFLILDMPAGSPDFGQEDHRFWSAAAEIPFVDFDPLLKGFYGFIANQVTQRRFHPLRSDMAGGLVLDTLARSIGLDEEALSQPLRRALEFIDEHYCAPITVAALARAAGLSESRLHAVFKARFRLSPMCYIIRQRLRKAARLLEATQLPIVDVALNVGYGDQSAFTRAFHREMGQTPGSYRRLRQKR